MKQTLILVSLLAACGSDSDPVDAGPDANLTGTYSLSWTVNGGSMEAACDAVGAATVRVVAFEQDAALGVIDSFNCEDFSGTSRGVPAGTYRFEIDLRSVDGRSLLTQELDVFEIEVTVGGNAQIDTQAFNVTETGGLTFAVAAEGASDNCADAAITGMRFNLRDSEGTCVPTTFVAGAESYNSDCTETPTPLPCIESDVSVDVAATPSGPHMIEMIGIVGDQPCRVHSAQVTILGNSLEIDLGTRQLADTGCP